jgi:hypothetical protein
MVRSALEDPMNPEQKDPALAAAVAVSRRLLVRAIDLRFNLDEAVERANGSHRLTPTGLQRLRADAAALQKEINRLALALSPADDPGLADAPE